MRIFYASRLVVIFMALSMIFIFGCYDQSIKTRLDVSREEISKNLCSSKLSWERERGDKILTALDLIPKAGFKKPIIASAFCIKANSKVLLVADWIDVSPKADRLVFYGGSNQIGDWVIPDEFKRINEEIAKKCLIYYVSYNWPMTNAPFFLDGTNLYVSVHNQDGVLSERRGVQLVIKDDQEQMVQPDKKNPQGQTFE